MLLKGPSHDNGGIAGKIKETGQPIEVEGDEMIINKRSTRIKDHIVCKGTGEGIGSALNELGGGKKWSDKGNCQIIEFKDENKMENEKYKVVKVFRKSGRREVIEKNLSIDEARRLVNTFPDSNTSMVVFTKMKDGSKIKSHIDSRKNEKIERMIISDNQLKKAQYGEKIEEGSFAKINEPENFDILNFLYSTKDDKPFIKVFKSGDICIYKLTEDLTLFMTTYGIHYSEFDNKEELDNWLKSKLPARIKNKL